MPSLTKESWFRDTTSAEERFCVKLRHLVTGDSSHTIISHIKEACGVTWDT